MKFKYCYVFCIQGALFGSSVAMAVVMFCGLGNQIVQTRGFQAAEPKPTSLVGCDCNMTYTTPSAPLPSDEYVYYSL